MFGFDLKIKQTSVCKVKKVSGSKSTSASVNTLCDVIQPPPTVFSTYLSLTLRGKEVFNVEDGQTA